jgi:hypothetical protein
MSRESWLFEIVDGEYVELYHIDPKNMPTYKAYGDRVYVRWGSEYMPWNNTKEAKEKERRQKINDLQSRIDSHKRQAENLKEELFKLMREDD